MCGQIAIACSHPQPTVVLNIVSLHTASPPRHVHLFSPFPGPYLCTLCKYTSELLCTTLMPCMSGPSVPCTSASVLHMLHPCTARLGITFPSEAVDVQCPCHDNEEELEADNGEDTLLTQGLVACAQTSIRAHNRGVMKLPLHHDKPHPCL